MTTEDEEAQIELALTQQAKAQNALGIRQTDYVKVFQSVPGKRVLEDVMSFCYIGRSLTTEEMLTMNDRMAWMILGRQEVGQRILHHTKLSQEELFNLYSGKGRIR